MNISFPQGINSAKITLYNVLGSKLSSTLVSSANNQVDVSSLVSGVYIAVLETKSHHVSFKIVKK